MWVELICGLLCYKLIRGFFDDDENFEVETNDSSTLFSVIERFIHRFFDDDENFEVETNNSNALFTVAKRLEKLHGGKAYVGLRIPDTDTRSRQNIDIVLVTKGEAVIISVKNLSGLVSIEADGSWVCTGGSKRKPERHPDPVAETKRQIAVMESYLEQRGVALPEGYLSCKVICPNPNLRLTLSSMFITLPPEIITYQRWIKMKSEAKSMFSGWIKGAFRGGKKEMQDSIQHNLNFILRTAPMWDRLELKDNKYLLGEFLEFKGNLNDIQTLRNIKRSKVNRLVFQKIGMFGLAHSKHQVLYSPRDYRSEGSWFFEWNEIMVRPSTEVFFKPQNSTKVRKFKLSSIVSMSLSA